MHPGVAIGRRSWLTGRKETNVAVLLIMMAAAMGWSII
jgi:hypothetical protein